MIADLGPRREVGTLVRGSENPPDGSAATSLAVLAKNSVKSYGVCIAMGNVFFTDSEKHLYGVKKHGGRRQRVRGGLFRSALRSLAGLLQGCDAGSPSEKVQGIRG